MSDDNAARPAGPNRHADDDRVVAERVQSAESPGWNDSGVIRETIHTVPGSGEMVPATETVQAELRSVRGRTVVMDRSGAEQISSDSVTMERSGSKTIEATTVRMDRSGVVALGSDSAELHSSSAVQIVAEQARITDSSVVFLSARQATVEGSRIVLFAGTATGDVSTVLTARSAAILAGGLALGMGLVVALLRRGRG